MLCVQIALWEHTVAEENSYHVPLVQEFDMQGLGKHLKTPFSAILYSETEVNYLLGRESQQDDEKMAPGKFQ